MATLKERVLDVLVTNQLLKPEQLEDALKVQREQGGTLQKILVDRGYIKEADLLTAISRGLGIPPVSLGRIKINPNLKSLITREVARQYQVVPIACIGQTLTVAMADPLNVLAIDMLTTMTGLAINPLLASTKDVQDAIDSCYGTGVEETIREIVKESETSAAMEVVEIQEGKEDANVQDLIKLTQELPVVRLTNAILSGAIRLRASDLLIEPMETRVRVRYRVDGIIQEGEAPPKHLQQAVISRIKVMAELNIAERRLPQDGHFSFRVEDREIDFRVSVLPSSFGENMVLRILDKGQVHLDLTSLGFAPDDLERIHQCAKKPHGMFLVTGPTGSGKTTTLYSMLKLIDAPDRNLVTVEDPVEYQLAGINQVSTKADIGLTFARSLRAILRQDPDVIMVGEIRDAETADMAVKSALTGHLVLSTLHTNSAAGTIVRLVNMGTEPFLLSSCLMAVTGQRLVRTICPQCKELYKPAPGLAKKLGLVDAKGNPLELARGAGCPGCTNSGYKGRQVIAEIIVMTNDIREIVLRRGHEQEIEEAARKGGMRTLREHALDKVTKHITTLDEVFRTTIGQTLES